MTTDINKKPAPTKKQIEEAFDAAVNEDNLCNLGRLLASLPKDQREVIEAKVADDIHYSAALISRVLKGLGLQTIGTETISKHRRNDCRCRL